MRRKGRLSALALLLFSLAKPALGQAPSLEPVAEIGPWPVVSQLIGFDGAIWFVNSVKGVNHNSADLYHYTPVDGTIRFQRSLFSQDAGDPVVVGGRLYWPLEDSRNSVGWAEVTVTDGTAWQRHAIPTAQAFHNHAMTAWRGRLFAATSAWRAGIQVSGDGGRSWRKLYDHPTPERRVSRLVKIVAAETFLLGHLIDVGRHRLLVSDGERTGVLEGWPEDLRVTALAPSGDTVLVAANLAGGIGLWRSDGASLEPIPAQLPEGRVQDLEADGGRLWLLTSQGRKGAVWSSSDGLAWGEELRLEGGTPTDLYVTDLYVEGSSLFVGGTGANGLGALWASAAPQQIRARAGSDGLAAAGAEAERIEWTAAGAGLDRLLADAASYRSRAILRNEIHRLAMASPPPGFFADRLARIVDPGGELPLIGGQVRLPNRDFGIWLLLWGMGISGESGVPPSLLLAPWRAAANSAEKYFEPAPAALWAVAMAGQSDRATIAALIERLGFADDPDWLRNQVAGTLSTLTGEPKRLEQSPWQEWWARVSAGWRS